MTFAASVPMTPGCSIAAMRSPSTATSRASVLAGVTTMPPRTSRSYIAPSSLGLDFDGDCRPDPLEHLVGRHHAAVQARHDPHGRVVHGLAVGAAGILDEDAVE